MSTVRKTKESRPVLAVCYDFDKTLSPSDMQAQGYIQAVYDGDIPSFWQECNKLAEDNEMDSNLAYMYKMVSEARGRILLNRKSLQDYGSKVKLFPGVEGWFERIREYGDKHGVIVEHYIISSAVAIVRFKHISIRESVCRPSEIDPFVLHNMFCGDFLPVQVFFFHNTTDISLLKFLFRISKGVLDVNDFGVNDYFAPEDIRVPFRNMVYIGDSDTDIPCMKLVNSYGGHSVGVYNSETHDKTKVCKMLKDNRIKYFAPADYTEGGKLEELLKAVIDRTAANEVLENYYYDCKNTALDR